MAEIIPLRHKTSGIMKDGVYGFSWTTFFFGCFPALFRGDFLTFVGTFVVLFFLGLVTAGIGTFIGMFLWAFFYNSYYTKKLLEKGYEFAGTAEQNAEAAKVLEIQLSQVSVEKVKSETELEKKYQPSATLNRSLDDDGYKIYLVKKYPLEFNDVLKKHIFNNKLYESVEDALVGMHEFEIKEVSANQSKIEKDLSEVAGQVTAINLAAQPYIDIILRSNYSLTKTTVVNGAVVWEFKVVSNGEIFEINSLQQLKDLARNFGKIS
jgi:hypothetical protein